MHKHYAALVEAVTADAALNAADDLLEHFGPLSDRPIFDWYSIGGRWSCTLQHLPDAPAEDFTTKTGDAIAHPDPAPNGANAIRAGSLDTTSGLTPGQAEEARRYCQEVAEATQGLPRPPFPGSFSDPNFMDEMDAYRASEWAQAAGRVWATPHPAATPQAMALDWETAPFLDSPELYVRHLSTFSQTNMLCGYLIASPTVFTTEPEGLDSASHFVPQDHQKNPWKAVTLEEQIIANLHEDAWIVSLDLHD